MTRVFDEIWNRIISCAGESFYTKTGIKFKYYLNNDKSIITDRTNYKLYKNDFEKAFKLMPIDNPGKINNIVRGPAYIWAILNDKRISM
ncbi:hypothetical protein [Desulfofundulus thermocisternus]|jgi:hypothetical protein|uniref:hypothetical protein n=1 Tax=Desulfofundulus thermocisternus TaxID=42471 RepID=UPI0004896355|nr:hypothetical protein [Desulfofundulus thermocisternus]